MWWNTSLPFSPSSYLYQVYNVSYFSSVGCICFISWREVLFLSGLKKLFSPLTPPDWLKPADLQLPFVQPMGFHHTSPSIPRHAFTHAFRHVQSKPVLCACFVKLGTQWLKYKVLWPSNHVDTKTAPLFWDSNRHAPPSCHHIPNTHLQRVFKTSSVLVLTCKWRAPLINTLLWFSFP